jgi:hypothetical protein
MTPDDFIRKWDGVKLKEKQASQEHFLDLCALAGVNSPALADPEGAWFCFEKGASKAGGGEGWADVWRKGCFAWEYKSPGKDLDAAFKQLQLYTPALEYPPLLIVSDIDVIRIHTAFTGMVPVCHVLTVADLRDPAKLALLRSAFIQPERLKPTVKKSELTEQAAAQLGALAQTWRGRGHDPLRVAHFTQQILFCLFAEDIDLLPDSLFTRLIKSVQAHPERAQSRLEALLGAMATGGEVAFEEVPWFNGGLFTAAQALPLELADLKQLQALASLDWSAIDPTIAGTLFVRSLDPALRAQLGAEYTDSETIMRLVNPVVLDPMRAEWAAIKTQIQAQLEKAQAAKSAAASTKARNVALELYQGFLHRLQNFRVLDPACGSGNFLLLSLLGLKDLEHQVITEAEALGLGRQFPAIGPENLLGIELNPFAAELARVSLWIGEIQWMLNHGFALSRSPILRNLDNIQLRDAVLNPDGTEPEWPEADAIVGNPPFLGGSKLLAALGGDYVTRLRSLYQGRVPGGADLVTYWFEKARAQIAAGRVRYVGLVATNSIRGGANRNVLERIGDTGSIYEAWSDEPWINEGAAVRVSLVAFTAKDHGWMVRLDGQAVDAIHPDLTASTKGGMELNLTVARPLLDNGGTSFRGTTKNGPFDIPGNLARQWLTLPNPNARPNSDVLKPWCNGQDITRRASDTWIIDFGVNLPESDACQYERPFRHAHEYVRPMRAGNRREAYRDNWWIFGESRPGFRCAVSKLNRFIATAMVAKHRIFVWLSATIIPDQQVITITRSDDTTFGILHSRFHELWSLRLCTWLGKGNDPRYTPTTTFETFPFPEGLTPADTAGPVETREDSIVLPSVTSERRPVALAIAQAAHRLNDQRENWLNPPTWVERVPEVVPGYPDRIIPKPGYEKKLKAQTLTNLYNQRPTWLDNAHQALDAAVAVAYGWADYSPEMPDEVILSRLLALNLERAKLN